MSLSYNVSALPSYVEQRRPELIAKAVVGAKSANLFTLQSGIKGPTALNLISSNIVFGDGATCGWTESGATSLSQAILTPRALKINMSICDKTLLDKWANYLVRVEADKTDRDLPFEQEFIDDVIKNVKAGVEKMIYQGDASNGSNVEFDGLLKTLTASGNTTILTTGASSLNTLWEITQGHRDPPRQKMMTYRNPMSTAKKICTRFSITPIPLPLMRLMICPRPKVTLETTTAHLMLSRDMALNKNPRKISSSRKPTQSILTIKHTVPMVS